MSYRGPVSTTLSGKTCQPWDSRQPHDHDFLPTTYPDSGLLLNYCRNPGEFGSRPWCLTTDPSELWDYCNVPDCGKNCAEGIGETYRGNVSSTQSHIPCQSWSSQSPHRHDRTPANYSGDGLVRNYCRNPGLTGARPWCLTSNPSVRWDYCSVPRCGAGTTNIALHRLAAQSSTAARAAPGRAVDGNDSPVWVGESCTHTTNERDPWWRVDLGTSQSVGRVVVTNRKDCCSERLEGFRVYVGDNSDVTANPTCGGPQSVVGKDVIAVNCGRLTGRYVGIALTGAGRILTLCEVKVFGGTSLANATASGWNPAWGPYPGVAAASSPEKALNPSDGGTWKDWQKWSTGSPLPSDYDSTVSPVELLGGKSLPTSSGVKIRQVDYLDEEKMELNLRMTFKVAWSDVRLQGLSQGWVPVPSHLLWLPPFRFGKSVISAKEASSSGGSPKANSNESSSSDGDTSSVSTWLSPDGQVSHIMARELRVQCPVDLRRFPVDTQECLVELHAYGGTVFELSVTEESPSPLSIDLTNVLSQYKVTGTLIKASVNSMRGQELPCEYFSQRCSTLRDAELCAAMRYCDPRGGQCQECAAYIGDCRTIPTNCSAPSDSSPRSYSTLEVGIHLQRRLPYFIFRFYIPTTIAVVVSWMAFWIHHTELSPRVFMGTVTYLVMVKQRASMTPMPYVSYTRAIDVWYLGCLVFVVLAMLEFPVIHVTERAKGKKNKEKDSRDQPVVKIPRVRQIGAAEAPPPPAPANTCLYKQPALLDSFARVAFPTAFTIFFVTYWMILLFT
ncbi:uncharacterized protein [Branchiostoma lanceolatum]|uniref:uncharacterized protein n=1 Tax=Branchiostoma lanceolatum TaxID=7740 RepID=UPI003451AE88